MALKSPPRGRASARKSPRKQASTQTLARRSTRKGGAGSGRATRSTRSSRSARPSRAGRAPSQRSVAATKGPSRRRTLRTGAPAGRPSRSRTRRTARKVPEASRHEEPMEFIELPASGSAGASWESDSYTPKANLEQQDRKAEPRRRRGFFSLFGNG